MKKTTILLAGLTLSGVLAMSGCTSSAAEQKNITTHFQNGKVAFEQGQFTAAFNELMPAAKKGDAESEYAIGYMYFYGKGTEQNILLAKKWLEKSAKKKNQNAITALAIIKRKLESENSPFTGQTKNVIGAQHPAPMPSDTNTPPIVKTAPTPTSPGSKVASTNTGK